jgi:crotonobetainyl-CoA:carnitine CoA-transferase CaiB-like acyl-CoA transferase
MELAWVWSGPMVSQILGDLGAEVIKVEAANRFDLYRTRGLETMRGKMDEATRLESSVYFQSLNRNKLGLTVDLKTEAGLKLAKQLAEVSDVLVENFTVGTMARMGLGREALTTANPALVHLSMSGPGKGSSVENLRSYGLVLSALAGAEALIEQDGEFIGSPTFSLSDPNAALFGVLTALAGALLARETGDGSALDLSQIEAAATLAGTPVADVGAEHSAGAPVRELWDTDDAPEFSSCSGWTPSHHPISGDAALVAAPWRIAGARPTVRRAAPRLGCGAEVLRTALGLDSSTIQSLQNTGTIGISEEKSPQ